MKNFLNKKIALKIFFLAIFVIGGFVLFNSSKNPLNNSIVFEKNQNQTNIKEAFVKTLDTDKDGLKDWEEALWKTDPNNPDTDGDGTPDGEEVREGRDPLKKGPNDKITTTVIKRNTDSKNPTLTSSIVKKMMTVYSNMAQNNITNKQPIEKLNEELLKEIEARVYSESKPKYTLDDLIITKKDRIKEEKEYKGKIQSISKKYGRLGKSELEIINIALKTNDQKKLDSLKYSVDLYSKMVEELLFVKVPVSLSQTHLNIINSYYDIANSLRNAQYVLSDPVVGLSGVIQYIMQVGKLIEISKKINDGE